MSAILAVLLAEGLGQERKLSTYVSPTSGPPTIRSPQYPGLYLPSSTNHTDVNHRLNIDRYDVKMGPIIHINPPLTIAGGENAVRNGFPFMVSMVDVRIREHACGGSIISPYYVLTAAHCLKGRDKEWTAILVGEYDMSTGAESNATRLHRAAQFIIHPDYDQKTWNDIGLIRSATMFQFNSRVGPICLPFNFPLMPQVGDYLIALGWGMTSHGGPTSEVLQMGALQVVPQRDCQAVFNETASSGKQVCTFTPGKDTCQMDSGGPLVYLDMKSKTMFLAALVSFGKGCGEDYPNVNTKIFPYLHWIRQATNEDNKKSKELREGCRDIIRRN